MFPDTEHMVECNPSLRIHGVKVTTNMNTEELIKYLTNKKV